jgi:hypothetical protein
MGYLLVSIAVLGPGDEPATHDIESASKPVVYFNLSFRALQETLP